MKTRPGEEKMAIRHEIEEEKFPPMVRPAKTRLHSAYSCYAVKSLLEIPFYGFE